MINVVVVEDSRTIQDILVNILSDNDDIRVIATAGDGEQAVEAVRRLKPDVVTMDIHMPRLNGFEATRRIMENHPVPIVIVSGTQADDLAATFQAVEAGAVAFVRQPPGINDPGFADSASHLAQTVRLMAQIKVVRRWHRARKSTISGDSLRVPALSPGRKIVVIGASTGGPLALQTILAALPADFALPILVVQHMTPGFVQNFVEWLATTSRLSVEVARAGVYPEPGHVYVAPDGHQMGIGQGGLIALDDRATENRLCPAVSYLFASAAQHYGANTVAVLLSGMGTDGAAELARLRGLGATTIAQDKESSVVHGMPGSAIALGGVAYVLAPDEIAGLLQRSDL